MIKIIVVTYEDHIRYFEDIDHMRDELLEELTQDQYDELLSNPEVEIRHEDEIELVEVISDTTTDTFKSLKKFKDTASHFFNKEELNLLMVNKLPGYTFKIK